MNNGVVEMGLNLIPAGYKQTEVGVIPEDWVIEKLGVIGKFKNGINKSADDFGYGYPFVNLMDVFGKPEIIGDEHFGLINSTELDKKEYSLVQGDVLFIRSSVKPSGVGLTTVVMSDLMDTVYSGFLIRFRTDNQLVIEFKKHCFYEESFRNRVICASTISANTNINQDSLKDIYLVYPSSKKEQTAIANALSDVDALISELEKLIAKKQAIKTATMQQLLTGRTRLPQFALREDGTPKGTKPSELGEIPVDWEVVTLGTASSFINGRAYSLHEWENSGTPVIRLQNLTGRGDEYYYSNLQLPEKQYCKYGDLLFMWSATFGPVIWRGPKAIYHYHIWKIACEVGYSQSYLFYLLDDMTEKLKRSSSSGGTMLHVTKEKMESTKAAFPSYEEQTAIATILSDMDAEIQALEQRLGKTRQIKQGMMQELLTGKTRLPYDKE
ncbi:restriction endonuclease subunit S [Escherichia coli]|uniref:restriction endonuclease subunit S n=2 Tax=Escherichia coli TaxID=562 RepID=UPI000BE27A58|nr:MULTISPECIES: restriction endonuclease subunit S [Enterobacterales]EEV6044252.1 restriction endonuclease subunit S [Escherichia coli]EFA3698792.1 restriction endonuclease subunit S [Escherichia coli]EFA4371447.1 restriction endonuclease subunit S [Escherichia coli]EFF9833387.1 restriction endonuclease subunit S [Escherichia coli]EFG8229902.1 restriction endonuclease subunit S [Escherichia coli]